MPSMIQRIGGRFLSEEAQLSLGSAALRIVGARRLLGEGVAAAVLSLTGEPDDLTDVLALTRDFETWVAAWRDVSAAHADASEAAAAGSREQVRQLRLAALALAFANQAHAMADVFTGVSRELVAVHARLHALVEPRYEAVEVGSGEAAVPALLRVPAGLAPAPVVVILQGLERSKEQAFPLEDALCARGLATLTVDQPGVGAALAAGVTIGDAAVLDGFGDGVARAVAGDVRLDAGRLFLFGFSLGGAMALAIAQRAGAAGVVTLGAPLHVDPAQLSVTARRRARFAAGVRTDAEVVELLETVGLEARLTRLESPLLVLHGAADPVVDRRQAARIGRGAGGEVEVRVFPRGDHSCTQYASAVWALTADRFARLADTSR